MSAIVIRRPARGVVCIPASPIAEVIAVPKLTPAEERERLVRTRERSRHGEVLGIFRALGVVDLEAR